jgi:hypothetical protein
MNDQEFRTYVEGLKVGERVIETGMSGTYGWTGTIYISETHGGKCVMWDEENGGDTTTSLCWSRR